MQVFQGSQTSAGAAVKFHAAHQKLLPLVQQSGFPLQTLLSLEKAFYLNDDRSIVATWLNQQQLPSPRQILRRMFMSKPSAIAGQFITGSASRIELVVPTKFGQCVLQLRLVWCRKKSMLGKSSPVAKIKMQCRVEDGSHGGVCLIKKS